MDDSIEGGVSTGEGEGEEVGLSREHKVIHVQGTVPLVSKQQEQILERLSPSTKESILYSIEDCQ